MKNIFKDTEAQVTIVGMFLMVMSLIMLSIYMPIIITHTGYIVTNLTTGNYVAEATIAKLFPLAILVSVLSTIILYATAQQ